MDGAFNLADSSDWLNTPVSSLGPVEGALRCQICKDFFDTPMMTSCSHTFCSLCIRRCLTNDAKCPACRAPDQEIKLRSNGAIQELVEAFKIARPSILRLGEDVKVLKEEKNPSKRKAHTPEEHVEENNSDSTAKRRKTRSVTSAGVVGDLEDDFADGDYQPNDGLSACPICNQRMKEEEVYSHLDIHNEPSRNANETSPHFRELASRSREPSKLMERLPQLNYPLMKDTALRKKLSELGIPSTGPKILLTRRHTEWINLVNANCDSNKPKTKRELLQELEMWDRTQGRQIVNSSAGINSSSVLNKDFDGASWAVKHGSDFQQLINQARQKAKSKKEIPDSIEGSSDESRENPSEMNGRREVHSDVHPATRVSISKPP